MNFGTITDPAAATALFIQSADAEDLQAKVNAAIDATTGAIASISLAGAGDGHTFVVLIESAPSVDVEGGLPASSAVTPVIFYEAGSGEELAVAKTAAGVPPPLTNPNPPPATLPYVLIGEELAGSSKGTVFMGMSVFGLAEIPSNANSSFASGDLSGSLVAATENILDMASLFSNGKFSLLTAQQLQYHGSVGLLAAIDASVTVTLTGADAFPAPVTVEVVYDPLGTPQVIASIVAQVEGANEDENIALPTLGLLLPTSATAAPTLLDRIGFRVITPAGGVGTASGLFRVIQG
jgi:hypothetical protein